MPTTSPAPAPTTSAPKGAPARRRPSARGALLAACALCLLLGCLASKPVECGRLQDFIQNLVGGSSSSSSGSNANSNSGSSSSASSSSSSNSPSSSSSSSSSDNGNGNDSEGAANESADQSLTPMMSAMSPFMRYPSFYDSFGPASMGGFPGMSFSAPALSAAMSSLSPAMAAMASSPAAFGGAFSPASFSPASFGSFGATGPSFGASSGSGSSAGLAGHAGHHSALGAFGGAGGMSASTLSNVYAAASPSLMAAGYAPYYGRR